VHVFDIGKQILSFRTAFQGLDKKQTPQTVIATTSKKHILIIEDNKNLRWLLGAMLSKQHQVTSRKDGWAAMTWLAEGNIPDLILLDLQMPRLGGLAFLKNIRNSGFFRDIPVIVISGQENSPETAQCLDYGALAFVSKPFNPARLKQKINEAFRSEVTPTAQG